LGLGAQPPEAMGVGSGGQEGRGPPGFSYMVFFGLFCYFSAFFSFPPLPPWKRFNSAIFQYFLLFSVFFSVGTSLENFLPTPLPEANGALGGTAPPTLKFTQ